MDYNLGQYSTEKQVQKRSPSNKIEVKMNK